MYKLSHQNKFSNRSRKQNKLTRLFHGLCRQKSHYSLYQFGVIKKRLSEIKRDFGDITVSVILYEILILTKLQSRTIWG